MRDRGRAHGPLVAVAAIVALAAGACSGWGSDPYPSPPPPLRPNVVGVIAQVEETSGHWLLTMTDGRTIHVEPSSAPGPGVSFRPEPGYLYLASTVAPEFTGTLEPVPSYPGCWEAWSAQSSWRIAWDMGDSILFFVWAGIELPKAADYTSDAPTHDVDGRQAWTTEGQSVQPYTVCANSSGQIEWLRRTSRLSR
jgi:hypothetical protein